MGYKSFKKNVNCLKILPVKKSAQMPHPEGEIKKEQKKPWYKKAWAVSVAWVTGVGVFVALVNGWFLLVKNFNGNKTVKDSVKVITVPVDPNKSAESLDSCQLARKKLSETGVSWSAQSFVDALVDNDEKSVGLFLQGCMSVYTEKEGTSIILYALQPGVHDREWKLKLFIKSGFDVNTPLSDIKIMRLHSESLPPHYETKLTPDGYGAWNRNFKGPLGLWLITWMCYSGVRDDDEMLIKTIAESGDKLEIEKDFLKAMESVWGDTESYKQTKKLVYKYSNQFSLSTHLAPVNHPV